MTKYQPIDHMEPPTLRENVWRMHELVVDRLMERLKKGARS